MPAEIAINCTGNLRCTARQISNGQILATDASASSGGLGENFTPTDLLVVALGTCILTTMAMVGERRQLDLAGLSAGLEKEMAPPPGHLIRSIGMTITLPSALRLTPANRERWRTPRGAAP